MIYFIVFVLLLIPVVKYDWMAKTGGESGWYYLNLVVLILLAGLRYRVGGDTLMYMSVFDEYPTLNELKYFDFDSAQYNPLWYIFNAISKSIYDDFFVFQLIHASIVNPIFFSFFRKYCPNYYFSAILLYYIRYFCYFNMEVLRESLCICVLLLAVRLLLEKRWIPYYAMCVIALLIHYSALVMFLFPLLFVFFKKPSWVYQLVLFVGILGITLVVNVPLLLLSALSLDEQLMILAEKYLDNQRNLNGMLSLLIQYLPLFGIIFLRDRYDIRQKIDFTPIVMGVVVIYAFAMNLTGLSRLVNYFVPFILVYTVNTIYYMLSNIELKLTLGYVALAASFSLLCFNYYYYYGKDVSDAYPNTRFYAIFHPYHSIFSPEQDEHRERFIENFRDVAIQF